MRYLLLACLVLVGCGGKKEDEIIYPKKSYSPSELIAMDTLPNEVIKISGKIYAFDKPNNEQRWFLSLEDSGIRTVEDNKWIVVIFDAKDKEFSDSLRKWFNDHYKGRSITIKGKAKRLPNDTEKRVIIEEPEVQ